MVLLPKLELSARVEKLLITRPFNEEPKEVEKLYIFPEGIQEDRHWGLTRISGPREEKFVSKGSLLPNLRQVAVTSVEESAIIAGKLGVSNVTSEDLETNITLSGIPNLTKLPPGTKLLFPRQAVLVITEENIPCVVAGGRLEKRLGVEGSGLASRFVKAAMHFRGVVCMFYRPGQVKLGDNVKIIVPERFVYQYYPACYTGDGKLGVSTFIEMLGNGTEYIYLSSTWSRVVINASNGKVKYGADEGDRSFYDEFHSLESFIEVFSRQKTSYVPSRLMRMMHSRNALELESWEKVLEQVGWNGDCKNL